MAKDTKIICPLMNMECIEDGKVIDGELHACRFWITVQGKHPQTGEAVNSADCTFSWFPVLMIENSKVNRETSAAIESMRNESVTTGQQLTSAFLQVASTRQERLIAGKENE
jgi:hypothetical protein